MAENDPWKGVVKPGSARYENDSKREGTNPFLVPEGKPKPLQREREITNPFLLPEVKLNGHEIEPNGVVLPVNSSSLGHGLDLLTGDINVTIQSSTPVSWDHIPSIKPSEHWDLFAIAPLQTSDTFEDPLHKESDMESNLNINVKTKTTSDEYLEYVKRFRRSDLVNNKSFKNHMFLTSSFLKFNFASLVILRTDV